jgi:hypothetical protein
MEKYMKGKKKWKVSAYIGKVGFIVLADSAEEAEQQAMKQVTEFIHTTTSHQAALQVINVIPFDTPLKKVGISEILGTWIQRKVLALLIRLYKAD